MRERNGNGDDGNEKRKIRGGNAKEMGHEERERGRN
jgi:hypothetical protein